ncbi:MAG: trypsin-like peptidase domain-containing protein [Gemmatimonadetes bacterium]|nr:trypsin-like peptidase domain-containing protein [Gemmatimonadota bacterium]
MPIELRITSGSRAGQRDTLDQPVVTVGRHPSCDVRFHAEHDADVSARHAELRTADGGVTLHDLASTNGTLVNGARISAPQLLRDGDVIGFGAQGPTVEFRTVSSGTPPRRNTMELVAEAVHLQTRTLRHAVVALGVLVVVIGGTVGWRSYQDRRLSTLRVDMLLKNMSDARRSSDSLSAVQMAALKAQMAQGGGGSTSAAAESLHALEDRQRAVAALSDADVASTVRRNMAAVVFVAVKFANGDMVSGSGFNVARNGLVVTNRHVVVDDQGVTAPQVQVIFNGTVGQWRRAHVLKVSATDELAWLQIDEGGSYPVVGSLSTAPTPPVGTALTILGYPLGTETAGMGGDINRLHPRTSLGVAIVSKALTDTLQLDGWAAEGSSGSPVFNAKGAVVGVVFGGPREANGRIVYAVPSARVVQQMPPDVNRPK